MSHVLGRAAIVLALASACSSPTPLPPEERGETPSSQPAPVAPTVSNAPNVSSPATAPRGPARVEVPAWLHERAAQIDTATSLIGGDRSSVDVLFGQFEHPDEAIVRFDRTSGCAVSVVGPWRTISSVVLGRVGILAPTLSAAQVVKLAESEGFREELESIVRVYAARGSTGEDKLAFSLDGRRVFIEAGEERLLVSADGGAHFSYLHGKAKTVGMPIVDPAGRFALVRACTARRCGGLRSAPHRAALVDFDRLPRVRPLSRPSMHDGLIDPGGAWVLATRSDLHGRRTASKLCFDTFPVPPRGAPTSSSCAATSWVGQWHMLSASRNGRFGVVALLEPPRNRSDHPSEGVVRLSLRSLPDGAERESFDVASSWESYQWLHVAVSDRGAIAHAQDGSMEARNPFADPPEPAPPIVVRAGGLAPRVVASGKVLGWLSERELVVLDPTAAADPHGCGLVKVVEVSSR